MTPALITLAAVIITPSAAGAAYLAHQLRRDRHLIWRPGDAVPDVPQDAAIRCWNKTA